MRKLKRIIPAFLTLLVALSVFSGSSAATPQSLRLPPYTQTDCEWDENEDIENNDPTWETSTLRSWLNGKFLNAAFSASEKAMIPTVTVTADVNPNYPTSPGNDTKDQVFLLSIQEVNRYFSSNFARQCEPTEYAKKKIWYVDKENWCSWWLRSPGEREDSAALVDMEGSVYVGGDPDFDGDGVCFDQSVRPAMWIDLDS